MEAVFFQNILLSESKLLGVVRLFFVAVLFVFLVFRPLQPILESTYTAAHFPCNLAYPTHTEKHDDDHENYDQLCRTEMHNKSPISFELNLIRIPSADASAIQSIRQPVVKPITRNYTTLFWYN